MSKYGPVAPSAWNQLVAGAVTPADSWPPVQNGDCAEVHRALGGNRLVELTTIENDLPASWPLAIEPA